MQSFHSSLETGGNPPVQPFPTSIPSVTGPTLSPSPGVYNTTHASAKTTIIRTTTVPVTHLVTVVINGANRTLTTTGVVETGIEIPVTAASTVPISPAPTTPAYCANGTMNCGGQNVFLPIGTGPVPANVLSRGDHPVPRLGIVRLVLCPTSCIAHPFAESVNTDRDEQVLRQSVPRDPSTKRIHPSLLGIMEQGCRQCDELGAGYITRRFESGGRRTA